MGVGQERLKAWHKMVVEYILANPTATHAQIAEEFDMATQTVDQLFMSGLFKAHMEERQGQLAEKMDTHVLERLRGKTAQLAESALDGLKEKIEAERKLLGLDLKEGRETAEMALRALGFSPNGSAREAPTAVTNVIVLNAGDLAEARKTRARLFEQKGIESAELERLPATAS